MKPHRPNCGALLCALHSFFVVFLRMPACALCTPQNRPGTVAALGFLDFTFATPQYKLCALRHDKGDSHNGIFCPAFVPRPRAKRSKECRSSAPKSPPIDKCFLRTIDERLKRLADKSYKNEAF